MPTERAAANLVFRHNDFHSIAFQHADRRSIDIRIQNTLGASGQQSDSCTRFALGRINCFPNRSLREIFGQQVQHRPQSCRHKLRKRLENHPNRCRNIKPVPIRQRRLRGKPLDAINQAPFAFRFGDRAKRTDQITIRYSRRASRFTSKASQTRIDMLGCFVDR